MSNIIQESYKQNYLHYHFKCKLKRIGKLKNSRSRAFVIVEPVIISM